MSAQPTAASFTLPAYAKINLSLRVLGRRPDGYHELETVFQTITLHDDLTFNARPDEQLELVSTAPDVPTDETNLVLRAARALRAQFGVRRGARIELMKRIPAGGGLGGGSADAAVALVGLARLWQIGLRRAELVALGAQLGADVPFFFTGGTALGTGRGTDIRPLAEPPAQSIIVVTPGVKVATAEAYKALHAPALTKPPSAAKLPISRMKAVPARALPSELWNDFEPVIFRLQPEVKRVRAALLQVGAHTALMSGSGASVFGLFGNREAQARAAVVLEREPGWQVWACRTLARRAYRRALGLGALSRTGR